MNAVARLNGLVASPTIVFLARTGAGDRSHSDDSETNPSFLCLWMIEGSYIPLATLHSYRSSDNMQLRFMSQFFTLKQNSYFFFAFGLLTVFLVVAVFGAAFFTAFGLAAKT